MNLRLTILSGVAVLLASLSLSALIDGDGWLIAVLGALIAVAAAGLLTRTTSLLSAGTTTFLVLISVVPLLSGRTWAERIAGIAIVVIVALSAVGRRLRGISILASYLACLLIYLNLAFAPGSSYGFVIPSQQSMAALGRLLQAAFSKFQYAPPVPDIRGLALLVAGGVGLVAILVDVLTVRLRQPAIAGLPLLVLFSVPVASNLKKFGGPQMVVFAAALAGYLSLLSADGRDRLRMWGRLVTFRHVQSADETGYGPDTRDMAASGRRIGLAAVCLAIIIPVIVPTLHTRDIFGTTNNGTGQGSGGGHGVSLSPLLRVGNDLNGSAEPVLTYTTSSNNAQYDPQDQYLQVYVLNYEHNQWVPQYTDPIDANAAQLPQHPPGVESSTPVVNITTTVRMSKTASGDPILPLPYAPAQLDIGYAGWVETADSLMIYNTGNVSLGGLTYKVVSEAPDPAQTAIPDTKAPPAVMAAYGSYKGPDASKLLAIAKAETAGRTTALAKADALQSWFLGSFTYNLKPNLPNNSSWMLSFLTRRRGYCTQFAQAFAVLARLLGIPSRIAVGYTAGTDKNGTWQVTTADAHAWPELYFAGEGWLRFEPTPTGTHGQNTGVVPPYAGGQTVTGPGQKAPGVATQRNGFGNDNGPGHRNPGRNASLTQSGAAARSRAHGSDLWLAVVIPVVLLLLIFWPAVTRLLVRRRRWHSASSDARLASAAWRELTDYLTDYGLEGEPGETPRALARRVSRVVGPHGSAAPALLRISTAAERARYSRFAQPGAGLRADVLTVRRALAASVPREQRLRARLLPPSTLQAAWQLLQRGSEMLGWLDSPWPTVRRQVRRTVLRRATS